MSWQPGTNMAGAVPPTAQSPEIAQLRAQEASTAGWRIGKLVAYVAAGALIVWKVLGIAAPGVTPPAVAAVVPTTAATAVPPPSATPTRVTAVTCRSTEDGDGYAKDGLYVITGWTRAQGGLVMVTGIGWIPRRVLPCPTLSLPEAIYVVPTNTRTPVPSATATPSTTPTVTRSPVPTRTTVPTVAPTSTATPRPFLISCGMNGYVTNASGTPVSVESIGYPWQTVLQPNTSLWLNPEGARRFMFTASGRASSWSFSDTCWGGIIQ
jgi:hypothetical protein